MEQFIEVIAAPFLAWLYDTAQVVITAVPDFLGNLYDSVQVVITATPDFGDCILIFAFLSSIILIMAWHYDYV